MKYTLSNDNQFKSLCKGPVTIPDTITSKGVDIKGGVLDQAIFGPLKNYECRCEKYSGIIWEGQKCEVCGVEVTRKNRSSGSWIELNLPIFNPIVKNKIIKLFTDINDKAFYENIRKIIYFNPTDNGKKFRYVDPTTNRSFNGVLSFTKKDDSIELGYSVEGVWKFINEFMDRNYYYSKEKPNYTYQIFFEIS